MSFLLTSTIICLNPHGAPNPFHSRVLRGLVRWRSCTGDDSCTRIQACKSSVTPRSQGSHHWPPFPWPICSSSSLVISQNLKRRGYRWRDMQLYYAFNDVCASILAQRAVNITIPATVLYWVCYGWQVLVPGALVKCMHVFKEKEFFLGGTEDSTQHLLCARQLLYHWTTSAA